MYKKHLRFFQEMILSKLEIKSLQSSMLNWENNHLYQNWQKKLTIFHELLT